MRFALEENAGEEDKDDEDDEDDVEIVEKMSALYGKNWRDMTLENLMDKKNFKDVMQFLNSEIKTLTHKSVSMMEKLHIEKHRKAL